jgi:hypothetical protein
MAVNGDLTSCDAILIESDLTSFSSSNRRLASWSVSIVVRSVPLLREVFRNLRIPAQFTPAAVERRDDHIGPK